MTFVPVILKLDLAVGPPPAPPLTIFLDPKIPVSQLLGPDPGGVWDSKHKFSAKTHFLQKGSFSPADLAENLCVDSQTRVWTKTLVYVDFQAKNITKGKGAFFRTKS